MQRGKNSKAENAKMQKNNNTNTNVTLHLILTRL